MNTQRKSVAAGPREHPVLFSAPMILALLAGRKTMTRRIVKLRAVKGREWLIDQAHADPGGSIFGIGGYLKVPYRQGDDDDGFMERVHCPYGEPGDRLWVRETWGAADQFYQDHDSDPPRVVAYRATKTAIQFDADPPRPIPAYDRDQWNWGTMTWRPSIYMPRWASRLQLEITEVRVERAKAISQEDAIAEGAFRTDYGRHCFHNWKGPGPCPAPDEHHPPNSGWSMVPTTGPDQCLGSPQMAFANLWKKINGVESWEANPWAWVIAFRSLP